MSLISRITTFVTGTTASATEVNAEFDNILSTVNGNLDTTNLSGSAAITNAQLADIAMSKVLDLADDIAAYSATTNPGDTGTPSLPATLSQEMVRLRYRHAASRGYLTNVYYMDTGSATAAAWFEPCIVGRNMIQNPGFELHTGTATQAPNSWTLVGTPADVVIENPNANHTEIGVEKRSLRILTDASNEGISFTLKGLKTDTKYLIGMAYSRTAGEITLATTGALASGDYSNISISDSTTASTAVTITQGIVKPTTAPGDITVSITGTATGADWNIFEVWAFELADAYPHEVPSIPTRTAVYSTADDTLTNAGAGAWSNRSGLSLSQYIPYAGYRLMYEVTLCFKSTTGGGGTEQTEYAFRIQQTIDANPATTVEGPYAWRTCYSGNNEFSGGTVTLSYIVDNPTPGSTYAFTTDVYTEGSGKGAGTIIFNPTVATGLATQSRARLVVERI
jgi:hypothetical protein